LIEPRYYAEKERALAEKIEMKADSFSFDAPEDEFDGIYSVENGVADVNISGELSKDGPSLFERLFGYKGTRYGAIRRAVAAAESDPAVQSLRLNFDSPGGAVDGVDETWQAIFNARKPVTAYVDGMLASAAYWLASAADKIIARNATDCVGSIGVIVRAADPDGCFEQAGWRVFTFVSANAPAKSIKNAEWAVAVQEQVDAIERIFTARVAKGRGLNADYVRERFGSGGTFVAYDPDETKPSALRNRMIDEVFNGGSSYYAAPVDRIINDQSAPIGAVLGLEEEEKMTLAEFLAQNPAAKAEFDAQISEETAKAVERAEKARSAEMAKIIPVLEGGAYPRSLQAVGFKALRGETSADAFVGAVAVYDSTVEARATETAQEESKEVTADPPAAESPERLAAKALLAKRVAETQKRREALAWL
jgi:ClpP class serine protease